MIWITGPLAGENGRAFLDKRLGCLPVVLNAAGLDLVRGFHIEEPGQTAAFRAVRPKSFASTSMDLSPGSDSGSASTK